MGYSETEDFLQTMGFSVMFLVKISRLAIADRRWLGLLSFQEGYHPTDGPKKDMEGKCFDEIVFHRMCF